MGHKKKVEDDVLISEYERLENIWKVASLVGMCGQSVHERLVRLGKISPLNVFTEDEKNILRAEYEEHRNNGKLNDLASKMGRTKQFICRQAKIIGLTDMKRQHREYAIKEGSNPYARYHARVRSKRGNPSLCEVCGENRESKKYDWANLTGRYEDADDYKRMCVKCHRRYDMNRV